MHIRIDYLPTGIMGGHGNFAFNLVVKLSVGLDCVCVNLRL
jgi:hypothetical protein